MGIPDAGLPVARAREVVKCDEERSVTSVVTHLAYLLDCRLLDQAGDVREAELTTEQKVLVGGKGSHWQVLQ